MKVCVVDVETTFQIVNGNTDPSPYHPENELVSVGTFFTTGPTKLVEEIEYHCFYHNYRNPSHNNRGCVQQALSNTDLLVWHNGKFDRAWLASCGFKVPFACWDTMIVEYVLQCGLKAPLSLEACCERYGLTAKRKDLTKEYLDKGIGFEAMPWNVVEEYGIGDLISTAELFWKQFEMLGFENVADAIPEIQI